MAGILLKPVEDFNRFSSVYLNKNGRFVEPRSDLDHMSDGVEIPASDLPEYFKYHLNIPPNTTDVFIWVHGWRNRDVDAHTHGRRIFSGILNSVDTHVQRYEAITAFSPFFISVRWPSLSSPGPLGYRCIRNRASKLTEHGEAEFFLACLLGYIGSQESSSNWRESKVLVSRYGFFVHCVGHSFGGRFLTAAIRAAATPTPKTLSMLSSTDVAGQRILSAGANGFDFTVDTLTIFQMAAPSVRFGKKLLDLVEHSPLKGPILLTHSTYDRANCLWHRLMELQRGIGCSGAVEPKQYIRSSKLHAINETYETSLLERGITNVDANQYYVRGGWSFAGAHGDFLYEESIHLLLSAVNHARN
jgi:hypothetical protein